MDLLFCLSIKMYHFYNKPLILFSIIRSDPSCYLNIHHHKMSSSQFKVNHSSISNEFTKKKLTTFFCSWILCYKINNLTCSPLRLAVIEAAGESLERSESAFIRFFFCSLTSARMHPFTSKKGEKRNELSMNQHFRVSTDRSSKGTNTLNGGIHNISFFLNHRLAITRYIKYFTYRVKIQAHLVI